MFKITFTQKTHILKSILKITLSGENDMQKRSNMFISPEITVGEMWQSCQGNNPLESMNIHSE